MNFPSPSACLAASRLDKLLEAFEVAFDAKSGGMQRAADALYGVFRFELHPDANFRLLGTDRPELDNTCVRCTVYTAPCDAPSMNLGNPSNCATDCKQYGSVR